MREKLIELLNQGADKTPCYEECWDKKCNDCLRESQADHLIANGVTLQKWIPVEDKQKPKDRKDYFIAYTFGDSDMHFFGTAKYYAYGGNGIVDRPHFSNEGVDGMRVTHWAEIPKLPLPDAPEGE